METLSYRVPGMTCAHCKGAVEREVASLPGVARVEANLENELVTVKGASLDDAAVRAAIGEAGYEAVTEPSPPASRA